MRAVSHYSIELSQVHTVLRAYNFKQQLKRVTGDIYRIMSLAITM